jgi:hypothetical protein
MNLEFTIRTFADDQMVSPSAHDELALLAPQPFS